MIKIDIAENDADQRLDRFLRKYLKNAPLSMIYRMIRKDVKVNGRRAGEDAILHLGDELTLYISEEKASELSASLREKTGKRQFKIVYEDNNVLIVGKPAGLLTHGDSHEKKNTLTNQVCGYLQDAGIYDPARELSFSPAPVNRLDRNTTGLVIFGKTAESMRELTKAIRARDIVKKSYLAIVCGAFTGQRTLDDRLNKSNNKNIVSLARDGREAYTLVKSLITGDRFSLVEAELLTGRTHQIRVHLAGAGYPIAGDVKYGDRRNNGFVRKCTGVTNQLLHAYSLEFSGLGGGLEYMNGKRVAMGPPRAFVSAANMLLPGEFTQKMHDICN